MGDKVLQLVNSPEENVFNGDMGQIVGIIYAKDSEDKVDELVIQFDANEVTYKRNDWQKITLSYCCSIHKAQGSEFEMVILPMVYQYQRMLQRNLLYTAVTRSKDKLILLGETQAFETCVTNQSANRLTTLKERISAFVGLTDEELTKADQKKTPEANELQKQQQAVTYEEVQLTEDSHQKEAGHLQNNNEVNESAEVSPVHVILTGKLVRENAIDPLIGMNGLTPLDFM